MLATLPLMSSAPLRSPEASLDLDFVNQRYLLGRRPVSFASLFSFSRASSGTRFNASGVLETVAANQPRFDCDPVTLAPKGILIEESRTNLATESEFRNGINDASTRGGSISATTFSGFAGGIKVDWNSGGSYAYKGIPHTNGLQYTLSVILEMDDGFAPSVSGTNAQGASRSLSLTICGLIPTNIYAEKIRGNTYVVWGTVTSSGSINHVGVVKYAGNDNRGFKVTAYQFEQASFRSSYIPTQGSQVTRSPDMASINSLLSFIIVSGFSCYAEWENTAGISSVLLGGVLAFGDSVGELVQLNHNSDGSITSYARHNTSDIRSAASVVGAQQASTHKYAFSYQNGDILAAYRGLARSTSGPISPVSPINTLHIGRSLVSGVLKSGWIRRIKVYPRSTTMAQLQALTA